MQFRLLGPFDVQTGGKPVVVGRRRERCLLAVHLIRLGQLVSADHLVELLWDDPPSGARRMLQVHVSRVRAALAAAAADNTSAEPVRLAANGGGYVLHADPESVDVHRFRTLVELARAEPRPEPRGELLGQALALWRGPALSDLGGNRFRRQVCADLEEQRLQAYEGRFAADLDAGRNGELIGELSRMAQTHPGRERLWALLMLSLYRSGRHADALETFRQARTQLVDEFGVEPGSLLQRVHAAVLHADERLDRLSAAAVEEWLGNPVVAAHAADLGNVNGDRPVTTDTPSGPCYLPRAISDFTGRGAVIEHLMTVATGDSGAPTADVVLIDGMAGSGKTTLALHLAHQVAERYPDGQLYIDLHGHSSQQPVAPFDALDTLLRQLGVVATKIPDGLQERAALWRAELSQRNALVILDNAGETEQVIPLLSGGRHGLTLITSRRRLVGVDGAHTFSLDVLPPDEATCLLARIVGPRMVAAPEAAAEVARLCGYLPLALRLAAAKLSHRPLWSANDLADQLREEHAPLVQLAVQGRSVEAAFNLSYQHLDESARLVFRGLGLHPAGEFGEYAVAALTDLSLAHARRLLNDLVDAHLLETRAPGRYRLHDLLRDYAAHLSQSDAMVDREAALDRMCDYYLHGTAAATQRLERSYVRDAVFLGAPRTHIPNFTDPQEAEVWLSAERPNVLACVRLADDRDWHRLVCLLSRVIWPYLYRRLHLLDVVDTQTRAVAAATALDDDALLGSAHNYLASAYSRQGRIAECQSHLHHALSVRRRCGDRLGEAVTLANFGVAQTKLGNYRAALTWVEQSMEIYQELGIAEAIGYTHTGLGFVQHQLGLYPDSVIHLQHGLRHARQAQKPIQLANSLTELGRVRLRMGRLKVAMLLLRRARTMRRSIGDRHGEAECTCEIGTVYHRLGRHSKALEHQQQALLMMTEAGVPAGECFVLNALGTTVLAMGQCDDAIAMHERALALARQISDRSEEARAHHGLGNAYDGKDPDQARHHWQTALALFEDLQLPERHDVARRLTET